MIQRAFGRTTGRLAKTFRRQPATVDAIRVTSIRPLPQWSRNGLLPALRELASTFVQAAIRFNKIGEALSGRFCFSGVSQHSGPFAPGLGVCDLGIGRAKNHDVEWLRLHLRWVVLKAKSRARILHGAVEVLPSRNERKERLEINVHGVAAIGGTVPCPGVSDLGQFGFDSGNGLGLASRSFFSPTRFSLAGIG